jgi:hypothetical protein
VSKGRILLDQFAHSVERGDGFALYSAGVYGQSKDFLEAFSILGHGG